MLFTVGQNRQLYHKWQEGILSRGEAVWNETWETLGADYLYARSTAVYEILNAIHLLST
jgi:hypothetical protein